MKLFVPLLIASSIRRGLCGSGLSGERATVGHMLTKWTTMFRDQGIPEPESSIVNILAYTLRTRRITDVFMNRTKVLTLFAERETDDLCELRLKRMPVQYIIKEWDFRGLTLKMRFPVFIPRTETEFLLDLVFTKYCANAVKSIASPRALDIGCGSGAIALSLKKECPQLNVTAIDRSIRACELTRENAAYHNLDVQIVKGRITLDGIIICRRPELFLDKFDLIVSNPPYVPTRNMVKFPPELKIYEDLRAFDGGFNGLDLVKAVIKYGSRALKLGGKLFLEFDVTHPAPLSKWLEENYNVTGMKKVYIYKDIYDRDRYIEILKER